MHRCYVCFEPTSDTVCVCELMHAHPWCIIRCSLRGSSSYWDIRHTKCPGCMRRYKSFRVAVFTLMLRWVGWIVCAYTTMVDFLHFLASFPPGTHLAYFDESDLGELRSDEWDAMTLELWVNREMRSL